MSETSEQYSLQELVAAVTDGITSVDSLYCEYTLAYEGVQGVTRATYARSGDKWYYNSISLQGEDLISDRTTICCDNQFVYVYRNKLSDEGIAKWGTVEVYDTREFNAAINPDEMLGRSTPLGLSVNELLKNASGEPIGVVEADSFTIRIPTVTHVKDAEEEVVDVDVQLDPSHEFLPRVISLKQSPNGQSPSAWERRWIVQEYSRIKDEETERDRWFPTQGKMSQGATGAPTISVKVSNARINPSLDSSLFTPDIPDGVAIVDMTNLGRGRTVFKGSHYVIDARINELVGAAHEMDHVGTGRILFIALNALVVFALTFEVVRRHRKSSKK